MKQAAASNRKGVVGKKGITTPMNPIMRNKVPAMTNNVRFTLSGIPVIIKFKIRKESKSFS